MAVTSDKTALQGMGFSSETGGKWSSEEKYSKVCISIIRHTLQCHQSNEEKDRSIRPYILIAEEERVIDSWCIQGGMS